MEVWQGHHFQVPISNAPVRVGSRYRVEYYFIYFPRGGTNTGKRVVLKWTVLWKSAGHHFQVPQCASKSRAMAIESGTTSSISPCGTKHREACGPPSAR